MPGSRSGGKITRLRCCVGSLGFRQAVTMLGLRAHPCQEPWKIHALRWKYRPLTKEHEALTVQIVYSATWPIMAFSLALTESGASVRNWAYGGKQKRKFKATTNSKHTLPIAANLLARDFTVSAPNRAWVSDITYIPTAEGWLLVP